MLAARRRWAGFLKRDLSTIKRWTGKGRIVSNRFGDDGVRYRGIEIADVIIKGTRPRADDTQSEPSNSGPTGLGNGGEALPGSDDASEKAKGPSGSLSARRILQRPSKPSTIGTSSKASTSNPPPKYKAVPKWEVGGQFGHGKGVTERYAEFNPQFQKEATAAIEQSWQEMIKGVSSGTPEWSMSANYFELGAG